MMIITIIYAVILYLEWLYLRRNRRSRRTARIVIGLLCLLTICMDAIYLLKDRFYIGMIVAKIVYPLQQAIFAGG